MNDPLKKYRSKWKSSITGISSNITKIRSKHPVIGYRYRFYTPPQRAIPVVEPIFIVSVPVPRINLIGYIKVIPPLQPPFDSTPTFPLRVVVRVKFFGVLDVYIGPQFKENSKLTSASSFPLTSAKCSWENRRGFIGHYYISVGFCCCYAKAIRFGLFHNFPV